MHFRCNQRDGLTYWDMIFGSEDRPFILTGAGISAESGLPTFRGSSGLWSGYRIEHVATPEAFASDPALVWRFYSMRRREALSARPNAAHHALADLEQLLGDNLFLCTQNVDDLHERAGSSRVHHMHGSLFASRCVRCETPFPDRSLYETGTLPHCSMCGGAVRPHIVWFGETPLAMDLIHRRLAEATALIVVGTSGSVYPAAGFAERARNLGIGTMYIGPEQPLNAGAFTRIEIGPATEILPRVLARNPPR